MADGMVNDLALQCQPRYASLTLSFTQSQWHCFWRMLILGVAMAEEILGYAQMHGGESKITALPTHYAQEWLRLGEEVAAVLRVSPVR